MERIRKKAKYFDWIVGSIINETFLSHIFFSHVDSTFNITTVSVIAMAIFCAICLGIIVYLKFKPAQGPKEYLPPDPDRETYI